MEIVFQTAAVVFAGFFCFLAYKSYKRNWKGTTMTLAFIGAGTMILGQPWAQGFLKTQVLSMGFRYGEQLNTYHLTVATIENTLREQQAILARHQGEIADQQARLGMVQSNVLAKHMEFQAELANSTIGIAEANAGITSAVADLAIQRSNILDIQKLLRGLYSNMLSEAFTVTDSNRFFVVELPDSAKHRAIIYFKLKHVPIKESVQVQYHIFSQPPDSYFVSQNIVMFIWGGGIKQAQEKPFYVTYVADPTRAEEIVNIRAIDSPFSVVTDKPMIPLQLPRLAE